MAALTPYRLRRIFTPSLRRYAPVFTIRKSKSLSGPASPRAVEPNKIIFSGSAASTMRLTISSKTLCDTFADRGVALFMSLSYPLPEPRYSLPEALQRSLQRVVVHAERNAEVARQPEASSRHHQHVVLPEGVHEVDLVLGR